MNQGQLVVAETPQVSSFMARATDVFSSPGSLFGEIVSTPAQTTSWLLPYIFSLIMAIVFTLAIYNNPSLRQQVYEVQEQALHKAVADGRMSQEQMETAVERIESSGPVMFILIGGGSAIVTISILFFGAGLILWLVARFGMKCTASYRKMLEIYGLVSLIGLLGSVVTLLLMNMFNSLYATPGVSLFMMDSFDRTNKGHLLLSSLNIFTLWQTAVLGLGFAKISRRSTGMGMCIIFALWILWTLIVTFVGLGVR
jgi:Yip1 domain